jgi:hypothetical protein
VSSCNTKVRRDCSNRINRNAYTQAHSYTLMHAQLDANERESNKTYSYKRVQMSNVTILYIDHSIHLGFMV